MKQFERITWQAETLLDGRQQVKWLEFGGKTIFLSFLHPNGVVTTQFILGNTQVISFGPLPRETNTVEFRK